MRQTGWVTYPAAVSDPTGVVGRRVVAYLIDWVLLLALLFVPMLSDTVSFEAGQVDVGYESGFKRVSEVFDDDEVTVATADGLVTFEANDIVIINDDSSGLILKNAAAMQGLLMFGGAMLAMLVVLQGLTGATLGKLMVGIRTVREDGRPPGILKALVRTLMWIADGAFVGPLVGFIAAVASKGHRRLGDMVAKTFVVRSKAAGSPVQVPGLTSVVPGGWATPAAPPPGQWGGAPSPGVPAPPQIPGPPGMPAAAPALGGAPMPSLEDGIPAAGPVAGAAQEGAAADPTQPQWDAARNAYIAWDPNAQSWQQFDDASSEWRPIG